MEGHGTQVNLTSPGERLGSRRERMRARRNTPPALFCLSLLCEHGRLREGCQGEWDVGKGDPNETPRPARRVGWGIVV